MGSVVTDLQTFCRDPIVRRRIREFLGGSLHQPPTALYFVAGTADSANGQEFLPLEEMPSWAEHGAELNRSHWDRESLLCHLDIEYVNFDAPGLVYTDPQRAFELQEPVVTTAERYLRSLGIHPLKLMTGRGYHLVWRVSQSSDTFEEIAALGHVGSSLQHLYATSYAPGGELVSLKLGRAYAGLGLVMEFLAHQIKFLSAPHCGVPVELGAIEVGPGGRGRELISVDITEYADPISARTLRVPFTCYLKAAQHRAALGAGVVDQASPILVLPMDHQSLQDALQCRHDYAAAIAWAGKISAVIPDAAAGTDALVAKYRSSSLAHFHAEFYSQEHDAHGLWPQTYDRLPLEVLPACGRWMLEHPNDLLLRPSCVQRLVRLMLSLGWHPRHIAGLIRSKYERDFQWGAQWRRCDPATRADFYARVFTGLFVCGVDDLIDFNCQSAREEGLCFVPHCQENLVPYQQSLLDRRTHERLARRPFNRLFLPNEHF